VLLRLWVSKKLLEEFLHVLLRLLHILLGRWGLDRGTTTTEAGADTPTPTAEVIVSPLGGFGIGSDVARGFHKISVLVWIPFQVGIFHAVVFGISNMDTSDWVIALAVVQLFAGVVPGFAILFVIPDVRDAIVHHVGACGIVMNAYILLRNTRIDTVLYKGGRGSFFGIEGRFGGLDAGGVHARSPNELARLRNNFIDRLEVDLVFRMR